MDMTTEPLPTTESLSEAIAAAGSPINNWDRFKLYYSATSSARQSVLAHARTLDRLHGRTPIDPDLIEAREVCARYFEAKDRHWVASEYREGRYDIGLDNELTIALAAIKRGRELQRGFGG